jgi:acyl dehydratase
VATSISLTLRCQNKMLVGGANNENLVTVGLQSVAAVSPVGPGSSLSTTVAVADDTFVMGNLYNVAITDAPA